MDDENAIYASYRSGELDFIESMPLDEIPGLLASGELTVADYIGTYYVNFQVKKAPFGDVRVRKAMSLAIDRDYIVKNITRTGETPASGYVPFGIYDQSGPGSDFRQTGGDYYSVKPSEYQKNCDEARTLLAEAGFPGGEGFPAVEYIYNTNANHKAIGEALQQMWKNELGINITLSNEEWGTFLSTRSDGSYEIARNGWIGDFNDPISFLDMHRSPAGGNNASQYEDPAYDALIDTAKSTSDPAARYKAMHAAEDILIGDAVVAPVYYYTNRWMLKPGVKGMFYTPLGYMFFSYITK
jgi:oligopeptide transport system substrate-binding protein